MKILLVTPMPPQAEAPGAIPVLLYAQLGVMARRHDVTLVTAVGPDPGEAAAVGRLRAEGIDAHGACLMHAATGARWQRRRQLASNWLAGRMPWRTAWFWAPGIQQAVDRLVEARSFDLVHVEDNAMGVYRYPRAIPALLTEHEVRRPRPLRLRRDATTHWHRWMANELDWRRWPAYQRRVWRQFDCIQTFTPRDAEAVAQMAPEVSGRVRVNPFSVVLPPAVDPAHERDGNLLFVGNFTHQPNVDAALWLGREIMPRLRSLVPGVHLRLVGQFPPASVRELAGADVEVTGAVPAIEPWFAEAAVVVAPLRIGGGMRMKVLQAMAMGKAIVTTPRGADGLAVAGCRPPLVVAEDAEGIARATATLLIARASRQLLGQQARAYVQAHFSPTAHVDRLDASYARMLAARST